MTRILFVVGVLVVAWTIASLLRPLERAPHVGPPAEATPDAGDLVVDRRPVLLVPGWLDTAEDMAVLRRRLLEEGWVPDQVAAVSFSDPGGSNRLHAQELARAVDALSERTGSKDVDIVAFSMGGLATRWYLLRGEPVRVRRVAFLATPHRGTLAAHLAWGEGRDEMLPDSPLLDTLNAAPAVPESIAAITVRTPIDTHVIPGESATLPGVPDYEVCCPGHSGLLRDPEAFRIVRDFLTAVDPVPSTLPSSSPRG